MFQFYQRAWPRLIRDLKVPFQLRAATRRDETPVHEALREAMVNALIHADHTAPGGIVIERFADRVVIGNPGTLLIGLEQLRRGGVSECRNKALQQMFQMIGGGERAGSGFDRIQSGWRSQHWRAPRLLTQFEPDRVILEMPMVSLIPAEALEALQSRLGEGFRTLSEPEVQALATAYLEGDVSNARLQELLLDHPVDITRMLQGLCGRDFLVSDQKRRWTRYRLKGSPPDPLPLFAATEMKEVASVTPTVDDSIHLAPDSIQTVLPGTAAWEDLKELARPVASRGRVSGDLVRRTILRLCATRFLTLEHLGQLLVRNPTALRLRFVSPLVTDGALRLRYPESPNRPDQAYTAIPQAPSHEAATGIPTNR